MPLRSPIPWLAAALLLADCVLWPLASSDSFPTPELISCYALAFCQVSLVAIWTALGTAHGGVLFLGVSLWVCRLGGYRLVRRSAAKNLSRPVLDSPTPEIVS